MEKDEIEDYPSEGNSSNSIEWITIYDRNGNL